MNTKHKCAASIQSTQEILGVSRQEMADLLDVRPAVFEAWITDGIPATATTRIEDLNDLAALLDREITRSHISQIVRKPDAWLGNRTILEVIRRDGIAPIKQYLTRVFAYRE